MIKTQIIKSQLLKTKKLYLDKCQFTEKIIENFLVLSSAISIITTVGILAIIGYESALFFKEVSWQQFFLDTQWTPLFANQHFGIWPLVCGTLLTSAIAIVIAAFFGLFSAIYLSEFASKKTRSYLKPMLEILAGIPTVVYGYFALIFVTPLLQKTMPNLSGFNALSPGIVMGIMIMPMISSLAEDAISSVPNHLKEACYGLGARKIITIFKVILPTCKSGILAAFTLAIARAIGETMIVVIAAGQQPRLTLNPSVPIETMTAFIVQISMGDTASGTLAHKSIFAVASFLFLLTLISNLLSYKLIKKGN